MSDVEPTPARPGLRVFAPSHPRQPYAGWSPSIPTAAAACRCGKQATAAGADQVAALVAAWSAHVDACESRPERPCQHCGTPTRHRSSGVSGWPACPDCYAAWAERPVEQRRRQHAASRIAAREAQRAKTARLRKQMERDGYAPDVIALVVAEMAGAA
jgi:hypothetical protein